MTERKPKRKFDRTFKEEALNMWLQSDKTAGQIASELGIAPARLYRWREVFRPTAGPAAKLSMEQLEAQNAQLRSENERLRQQRDILKKTLGILSEPPTNATNASKL